MKPFPFPKGPEWDRFRNLHQRSDAAESEFLNDPSFRVAGLAAIPLTYGGLVWIGRKLVGCAHSLWSPGVSILRTGGELSGFPAVPEEAEYCLFPLPRRAR
jgi:hypothetical protein